MQYSAVQCSERERLERERERDGEREEGEREHVKHTCALLKDKSVCGLRSLHTLVNYWYLPTALRLLTIIIASVNNFLAV